MSDKTDNRVWLPMCEAPKDASEVEVMLDDGRIVIAHYACDLSGEEQPPFKGWFLHNGYYFGEINPTGWRPIRDYPDIRVHLPRHPCPSTPTFMSVCPDTRENRAEAT